MDTQYIQIIYIGTGIAVDTIGNFGLSSTEPPLESVLSYFVFALIYILFYMTWIQYTNTQQIYIYKYIKLANHAANDALFFLRNSLK